jgi:hypothetical protein
MLLQVERERRRARAAEEKMIEAQVSYYSILFYGIWYIGMWVRGIRVYSYVYPFDLRSGTV